MQLAFDMFYDDEFQIIFNQYFNVKFTNFLIMIPEILLILDSLMKLITGFYENGVVVTDKTIIVHHYLKNELIYDIFSYIPSLMQGLLKEIFPNFNMILKFFQFLMFFKIKQMKTALSNYEEIIVSNGKRDFFLKIMKIIYVIIFIAHMNACIWHSIAYFYPSDDCCTWLDFNGLKEASKVSRYIYSFYFAITIGFGGNITPQNEFECIFSAIILLISLQMFGYCVNSMKSIFDMVLKQENDYKYILVLMKYSFNLLY